MARIIADKSTSSSSSAMMRGPIGRWLTRVAIAFAAATAGLSSSILFIRIFRSSSSWYRSPEIDSPPTTSGTSGTDSSNFGIDPTPAPTGILRRFSGLSLVTGPTATRGDLNSSSKTWDRRWADGSRSTGTASR